MYKHGCNLQFYNTYVLSYCVNKKDSCQKALYNKDKHYILTVQQVSENTTKQMQQLSLTQWYIQHPKKIVSNTREERHQFFHNSPKVM